MRVSARGLWWRFVDANWPKRMRSGGGCNPLGEMALLVTMSPLTAGPGNGDSVTIRRFLDGDERAFRELYERHTPRLKMTLLRLLGRRREAVDERGSLS